MSIEDRYVTLAHGNGGRLMRELIEEIFARELGAGASGDDALDVEADAVPLPMQADQTVLISTDGFTVHPLEFPGGDIGSLAVHGTVNDLAVSGATPAYLSLNAFIEEGLEFETLQRLVRSLGTAATACGVRVAAGDTKVLRRGEGSGLYLATTGIGFRPPGLDLGLGRVRDGDVLLVSGPVGDHGTAVMLAREQFGLKGDLRSDAASVLPLTLAVRELSGLRFMRDPTRGGLATVAHEIARVSGLDLRLDERGVPVRESVRAVCEMLGYDPYYLACEGRVVAVVAPDQADAVLERWRALPEGADACIAGQLGAGSGRVILRTELGGERLLEELEDDPLPRIC
jgi:hydrogenase expression/formation protein HypE